MSALETSTFTILWAFLVFVAFLVVVGFRQIERAQRSALPAPTTLGIGERPPEIHIIGDSGIEQLEHGKAPYLLAFLSPGCGACKSTMEHLLATELPLRTVAVVTAPGKSDYADAVPPPNMSVRWIANPADARVYYKINVVPTLYVLRDGEVLAASNDGSSRGIERLLEQAQHRHETAPNSTAQPALT